MTVTLEHAEQLFILQHNGSFDQILEVRVDSRANTSILSDPLRGHDVNVVPHLGGQTGDRNR